MRDRPAIPHRRIKRLAMVVLQWHWLTNRGGVLRANPSTEDSCGVRCRALSSRSQCLGTWTAELTRLPRRRAGSPALCCRLDARIGAKFDMARHVLCTALVISSTAAFQRIARPLCSRQAMHMPAAAKDDDDARSVERSVEYYKGMMMSKPSVDDGEKDMLTPTLKLAGGASALLVALPSRCRRRTSWPRPPPPLYLCQQPPAQPLPPPQRRPPPQPQR